MTVAVSLEALPRRRAAEVVRDYVALTKPRVILLLEVTAVAAWSSPPGAGPAGVSCS